MVQFLSTLLLVHGAKNRSGVRLEETALPAASRVKHGEIP